MNKRIKKIILKWMGVKEDSSLGKNIPDDTPYKQQMLWMILLNKCYVPNHRLFPVWGAKGYRVCKEWKDHPHRFFEWLKENNWNLNMRIDIKEGKKIFSPSNSSLTIYRKYIKKRTRSFLYFYNGKKKSLKSWGNQYGIKKKTLETRMRYFHGDISQCLELPLHYRKKEPNLCSDIENADITKLYTNGGQLNKKFRQSNRQVGQ